MIKLISPEKMRELEKKTFDLGIDSFAVMEKAASRVFDYVKEKFDQKKKVLVVCGKRNNGGDGLAVARMLFLSGYDVTVCTQFERPSTADAAKNFDIVKKLSIKFVSEEDSFEKYDVIVDALFGTGLSGEICSKLPEKINASGAHIVAVDIPSGISAQTGAVCGSAVKADTTITFEYKKYGHSVYPGKEYCGKIVVGDIGLVSDIEFDAFETDGQLVKQFLPQTSVTAHKSELGKLCVIAGSVGMTGAATLCCEGALKSGCGLITLFTPENLNEIYEVKLTEAMTKHLPGEDFIRADKLLEKSDMLLSANAVVIGPGLGRKCDAAEIIRFLFENEIPTIIDADGINAVAANINILNEKKGQVVITPHLGEFARLTGVSIDDINKNKLALARSFATEYGVVLVLKGAGTIVATPSGKCYVNHTGNCGMATGGSGDVLAGVAGALLAKTGDGEKSAIAAAYIHGLAGDFAKAMLGEESMLPTDTIKYLKDAFNMIKNLK